MTMEEKIAALQALGEEYQALEEKIAEGGLERKQLGTRIATAITELLMPEILYWHSEARFDRFVQAAMQGLLAGRLADPRAVPQLAVDIARMAIALSDEFPSEEGNGSSGT